MSKKIEKIKLNLFKLKPKKDLNNVNIFFQNLYKDWFTEKNKPKNKYFESKNCILCAHTKSIKVFQIDNFNYHECLNCKSIFAKNHIRQKIMDHFYNEGDYNYYQKKFLNNKGKKIRSEILEKRKFNQVKSLLKKSKFSLLDVGCGNGTFLKYCLDNKIQAQGIESSITNVNHILKNYKLKIYHGDFNKLKIKEKYDVICFWGVLEHMSDPNLALSKAKNILKKNGLIVFEVPSADCFLSNYLKKNSFLPTRYIENLRHNIFFSKKVITYMAKKRNLKVEYLESNGLDVQTILFKEFDNITTNKILNIQDTLNDLLLGDHYRVFLKK